MIAKILVSSLFCASVVLGNTNYLFPGQSLPGVALQQQPGGPFQQQQQPGEAFQQQQQPGGPFQQQQQPGEAFQQQQQPGGPFQQQQQLGAFPQQPGGPFQQQQQLGAFPQQPGAQFFYGFPGYNMPNNNNPYQYLPYPNNGFGQLQYNQGFPQFASAFPFGPQQRPGGVNPIGAIVNTAEHIYDGAKEFTGTVYNGGKGVAKGVIGLVDGVAGFVVPKNFYDIYDSGKTAAVKGYNTLENVAVKSYNEGEKVVKDIVNSVVPKK